MAWDADRIVSLNSSGKSKLFFILDPTESKFLRLEEDQFLFGNIQNIDISTPSTVTDGEFKITQRGSEITSKMLMSQVTNFLLKKELITSSDEIELLQTNKKLKQDLDCHKYHRSLVSRS